MNRKRKLLQELDLLRRLPLPPISGKDALVIAQVALVDDPVRFCDRLGSLLSELRRRTEDEISPFEAGAPRLLVAGCPSAMGNYKIHHAVESSGGIVVCDESCTGTRYFRDLVDENSAGVAEMLDAVADRYFRIDCSCFSPNTERVERVVEMARECRADAVVQYVLQYCHTYNVEAIRVGRALDAAGIPWLTIESDYSTEDDGQLRTRVQALFESIRTGKDHGH
jgi:benzoyl-CoA reductase/2-hydroxyglutaryl-CoA dehydratase subunit BcrC/BadD/HgdB